MRNTFIEELVALAQVHPQLALVVGDLGYSVVEPFADRFPERFCNAGVSEQNMTSMAAGMASEGYHVFTYSIANFPTFRCAEQIRNDIAYHNLPVTVVAVGGGLGYGALGYSHHAVQDYALLRTMPQMLIAAPGDPPEVRACLRYLVEHPQASYLRLGKNNEPSVHALTPKASPGRWLEVQPGGSSRKALLTTGAALSLAPAWLATPEFQDYSLYSLPLWGMSCKALQVEQLAAFDCITTLEDHLYDGGFGSWLLEAAAASPGLVEKIRLKALSSNVCGMVASQAELHRCSGVLPQRVPSSA